MGTNRGARAHQDLPNLLPDYQPCVGAVVQALRALWGREVLGVVIHRPC
jgi:hypothetical protein